MGANGSLRTRHRRQTYPLTISTHDCQRIPTSRPQELVRPRLILERQRRESVSLLLMLTLQQPFQSFPFGWDNDEDGFRGHVFASRDNSTVVLSIKGTTLQGPTSKKDKLNDNLLFSCCCARVDFSWMFSTVCDCYSWSALHQRCDDTCLSTALIQDSLFYSTGVVSRSSASATTKTNTFSSPRTS